MFFNGKSSQQVDPHGKPTLSAHPGKNISFCVDFVFLNLNLNSFTARFSPEDKYSQHRYTIKKRFNLLPTQKPTPVF